MNSRGSLKLSGATKTIQNLLNHAFRLNCKLTTIEHLKLFIFVTIQASKRFQDNSIGLEFTICSEQLCVIKFSNI